MRNSYINQLCFYIKIWIIKLSGTLQNYNSLIPAPKRKRKANSTIQINWFLKYQRISEHCFESCCENTSDMCVKITDGLSFYLTYGFCVDANFASMIWCISWFVVWTAHEFPYNNFGIMFEIFNCRTSVETNFMVFRKRYCLNSRAVRS